MAMSATAAAALAMLMVVVAAALAFVTSTAAAFAAHVVEQVLDLLLGSIAVLNDESCEEQRLAGQRMVQVHLHLVLCHFQHAAEEVVAVGVLQGDDGTLVDVLLVEVAVNHEVLAFQVQHAFFHILAVGFIFAQLEGEGLSLLQVLDFFLKRLKGISEAADEVERTLGSGLFYKVFTFLIYREQFVLHGDIPVVHFCHFSLLVGYCGAKGTENRENTKRN